MNSVIATLILIGINILVFVLPSIIDFGKRGYTSFERLIELGWKDNQAIKNGEFYRLITSIFLHADIFHLISNMWGLWIFGTFLNPLVMLVVFFVSGIVGNIFSFVFNPHQSIGASGAVFGLVGFILPYFLTSGLDFFSLLFYVIISFVFATVPGSRIDFWGHVGGLLAGLTLRFLLPVIL